MADILQVRNEQTGEWVSIPCLQGPPGKDGAPGKNGVKGDPGFAPKVSITPITNGNKVSIQDIDSTKTFEVKNGVDGHDVKEVYVQSTEPTEPSAQIWIKIN